MSDCAHLHPESDPATSDEQAEVSLPLIQLHVACWRDEEVERLLRRTRRLRAAGQRFLAGQHRRIARAVLRGRYHVRSFVAPRVVNWPSQGYLSIQCAEHWDGLRKEDERLWSREEAHALAEVVSRALVGSSGLTAIHRCLRALLYPRLEPIEQWLHFNLVMQLVESGECAGLSVPSTAADQAAARLARQLIVGLDRFSADRLDRDSSFMPVDIEIPQLLALISDAAAAYTEWFARGWSRSELMAWLRAVMCRSCADMLLLAAGGEQDVRPRWPPPPWEM